MLYVAIMDSFVCCVVVFFKDLPWKVHMTLFLSKALAITRVRGLFASEGKS